MFISNLLRCKFVLLALMLMMPIISLESCAKIKKQTLPDLVLKKKYKSLQGCCSWHKGVKKSGKMVYTQYSRVVCKDLTISKGCTL